MKHVLVIDKDTVEEYVTKFSVDDIERDAIEHFIKHHNPGNLLAELKNKAVFCTDKAGGKRDLCFRIEESDTIRQDENYYVLILACPDEGSASDEGSEGK